VIIPFFLRNRGCPHRCVFCSETVTGGDGADVFPEAGFQENVEKHLRSRGKKGPVEIAFYGGNFLEMDETVQERLLRTACRWIEKKAVDSLRLSTRPDSITEKRLAFLRKHHVGTLEIGVQSLADGVLEKARRGHTAKDARRAVRMSLDGRFRTAVHLMTGLPGEKASDFMETVLETAALGPHMVRIHPTLVFRNTGLEAAWKTGAYTPLSLEEAVNRCRAALEIFEKAGVSVIRVGLQQTEALIGELVAGPYHPALRDLVASSSFLERAKTLLEALPPEREKRRVVFRVSPRDGSSFRGHRGENVRKLQNLYPRTDIEVREDGDARRGSLSLAPADGKGQAAPA